MSVKGQISQVKSRLLEIDMKLSQMDAEWQHSVATTNSFSNTIRQIGASDYAYDGLVEQEGKRNSLRLEYAKIRGERELLQNRLHDLEAEESVERAAEADRAKAEAERFEHAESEALRQREIELELKRLEMEEAERERDHKLQMQLSRQKMAEAQLEAARLAAEANIKAQEQSKASFDALLKGVAGDGKGKDT